MVLAEIRYTFMKNKDLFSPVFMGPHGFQNRMAMAPLTRCRAEEGALPSDMAPIYYAQRSSVGLLITEATQISQQGQGYVNTPGIYSEEQVVAWKRVVDAVHEAGGKIFLQLWHVGRHSHSDFQENNELPVAPSAVNENAKITTPTGSKPTQTPRALTVPEIQLIVEDYRNAAKNALEAGFDGVEVHGANGYLINQFLDDTTNIRTDEYGGNVENRYRFLKQILDAVIEVYGEFKVGLRLSPFVRHCNSSDSNPLEHYSYYIRELNKFPLAYLHLIEPLKEDADFYQIEYRSVVPTFRKIYRGILIACQEFDLDNAQDAIEDGHCDMIAFGKLMISNPDLKERFENKWHLNPYDIQTFYGGGEEGYIDYPFYYQE